MEQFETPIAPISTIERFQNWLTYEKEYRELPLVSSDQLPDQSYVVPPAEELNQNSLKRLALFYSGVVQAFQMAANNHDYPSTDQQELQRLVSSYQPTELAQAFNIKDGSSIKTDVFWKYGTRLFVDALDHMTQIYPNISFFRGSEFGGRDKPTGFAYAPMLITKAIRYAYRTGGGRRSHPVLQMVSFKDVIDAYRNKQINVISENNWWKESNEFYDLGNSDPQMDAFKSKIKIFRLPPERKAQQLIDSLSSKSIIL